MDIKRLVKGSRTHTYNAAMYVVNGGYVSFLLTVDWQTAGFTMAQAVWIGVGIQFIDRVAVPMLRNMTTGPVGGDE